MLGAPVNPQFHRTIHIITPEGEQVEIYITSSAAPGESGSRVLAKIMQALTDEGNSIRLVTSRHSFGVEL